MWYQKSKYTYEIIQSNHYYFDLDHNTSLIPE